MKRAVLALPAALLSSLALAALAHEGGPLVAGTPNIAPSWLGPVIAADYDGVTDDLLTAGLGKTGLGSAVPPAVTDPTDPKQLRRLAIYNNYRALVDVSPGGGYGTFYGPNVRADGTVTTDEGRIAGTEYLAFADRGRGRQNVTLMVQVPASFDPAKACIVTGTSSGSRGVYGAIGTSGEWGLKRGCAVAYADKGTGNGVPPTGPIQIINNDSVGGPRRAVDFAFDQSAGLQRRRRAVPARAVERREPRPAARGAARSLRHRRGAAHGKSESQAGDRRARPRRHAGAGELLVAAVLRAQPPGRRAAQQAVVHRSDPGAALRRVPPAPRLRHALRSAERVLQPRARCDVRAPRKRRAAAASQVVRTTPRGGTSPAPALTPANVPAWSANPQASDRITFDGTLTIPD